MEGFIEFYIDLLPHYPTCLEAYEATERQHLNSFGIRKYSDYYSFKTTLSRYQGKKRKNSAMSDK